MDNVEVVDDNCQCGEEGEAQMPLLAQAILRCYSLHYSSNRQ